MQVRACNNKCCKKEVKEVSKKLKKDCCESKPVKKNKQSKDNCTGDCNDCTCASPTGFAGVLIPTINLNIVSHLISIEHSVIPFTETLFKSIFIEFWQPPKL